jgi:hypothetical protein
MVSDPLATLGHGDYGTDLLLAAEAVGADYDNEDLTLVRVYRQDDHLRSIETDEFVRRLRGPGGDPQGNCPPGVDSDEGGVSPLLLAEIPSAFVTLETPTDENVVTRVMALEVSLDKLELLTQLGAAYTDSEDATVREFEALLDDVGGIDDTDAVEHVLRQHLF